MEQRRPLKQTRQTLLPFSTIDKAAPSLPASSQQVSHAPPKPAPVLPREIWDRILGPLGTLSMKTFRLVCREWSILGAERLYSTLYLNSYTKCWSGLIAISETGYATLVEKIVWNPIALLDECVDGEAWASRYNPLLKGLKHSMVLQFYEQYIQIHNHLGECLQPFSVDYISSISDALCKLTNCHELVVSEDHDLENRWSDPCFRRRLQNDSRILQHPSTWACRPHWWYLKDDSINVFLSLNGLLNAAARCAAITYMIVDLEPGNMSQLVEHYTHVPYPHIESLVLRLSHSPIYEEVTGQGALQAALEHSFFWSRSFPGIHELCIEVKFQSPSSDMVHFLQGQQDDSDDSLEVTQIVSRVTAEQTQLYNLPETFCEAVRAEMFLPPVTLPNLRTLRLANITLDVRHLLRVLCIQPQLPHSKISIHLNGTTIFYGLLPPLFLDLLCRLNVDMHYEPLETYYYTDFLQGEREVPYADYLVTSKSLREWGRSHMQLWGMPSEALNMPNPVPKHSKMDQVEFKSRPSDLESIALSLNPQARREEWNYATPFTYQICIEGSHTVCEWVTGRRRGYYDSFPSSTSAIVPLLTSNLYFNFGGYGPYREEDLFDMAHRLEGDLLYGHGSIEDQHLLAQFEVEHLGLDVIETGALGPVGLDVFSSVRDDSRSQRSQSSLSDSWSL